MTAIELIRMAQAHRSALYTYARAHDKFAELEQRHTGLNPVEAAGAHEYALRCLRAYRAETDDTPPAERSCTVCAGPCRLYPEPRT